MRLTAPPPPLRRSALLAVALAVLAGCASAPKKDLPVWPQPPETPRIKFLRSFGRTEHMKKGGFSAALGALSPTGDEAAVLQPSGLALSPDDRFLFVACSGRLLRVDLVNDVVAVAPLEASKRPGRPLGVAVDGASNLYVSDGALNAVLVFGPDGKFLRLIDAGKLERPAGLAIDRKRQLLYVVAGIGSKSKHHRVEVFSLAGEHLRTIGTRGAAPGDFNFPTNLAVAPGGNLYVVDMLNFRIQVFDPEGDPVAQFGQIGDGAPGTFNKAKGIAFDAFGNLYVSDSQMGYVQMFNPDHQVLMAFSGRGQEVGQMLLPTAVAITSRNTIYVADFALGRVNEFQLVNTTAEDSRPPASPTEKTTGKSPTLGE